MKIFRLSASIIELKVRFVACRMRGARFKCFVNSIVYGGCFMTQVQIRLPERIVKEIDKWVVEKGFKSRSDAIRAIISFYEERQETRKFFKMLVSRSEEAKKHPEMLIPLEES